MTDQIKNQLDFYFSNANIRTDKFLQTELQKNNNKVKASTILSFNNMKKLNATFENLKEAVKTSKLVEYEEITGEDENAKLDKDDFYIAKMIDDEYNEYFNDKEIENRILIIKGLDTKLELKDIEEHLQNYFKFTVIRMRRDYNKAFKGSVFVELSKSEDVENVLKMKIPTKNKENKEETAKRRKIENVEEKENDTTKSNEDNKNSSETTKHSENKTSDCAIDNFLLIKRKNKYFKDKKEEKQKKKESKAKNEILEKFKGKYYKYESETKEIKAIKQTVEDVAFVDLANSVLRFKKEKEFEEKEFEKEGIKVKVTKLNEEEAEKYAENINFKSVTKTKKKVVKKGDKK